MGTLFCYVKPFPGFEEVALVLKLNLSLFVDVIVIFMLIPGFRIS